MEEEDESSRLDPSCRFVTGVDGEPAQAHADLGVSRRELAEAGPAKSPRCGNKEVGKEGSSWGGAARALTQASPRATVLTPS